jgi:cell division protein FtsQ
VAFVRQGQQIGLVDANGVLLTMPAAMMAQHHYSFPVVTGIGAGDPPAARKARMEVYQRLLAELDSNGQRISEQISEIDVTDTEDLQVLMPEQGGDILLQFGEDRFLERYQHYKAHIAEWRQQYPKLTGVDLRLDPKFILQMASGTDGSQAAATEQAAANTGDAKPSDGQPAGNAQASAETADGQPAVAKPTAGQPQPVAKVKSGKPEVKSSTVVKSAAAQKKAKAQKAAAAKAKAALETRKRAEAKRAAINLNKQKNAPTIPPVTSAGLGQ